MCQILKNTSYASIQVQDRGKRVNLRQQGSLCRVAACPRIFPTAAVFAVAACWSTRISLLSRWAAVEGATSPLNLDGGPQPGRGRASYRTVALPQPPADGARRWWTPSATGESLPPRSRRRGWWTQSEAGDWRRRSAGTSCPSAQPLGRLLVRSIISLPLPPTDHLEYATSFWCHIALSIGKYKIMKLRYAWVCAKSRIT